MIQSFHPPVRTLMGPGPSDVSPRVLSALARPTIGHLDPAFVRMMDELKELLHYAFQTRNPLTLPVSAPGSAGMEACFVNLIEPGDKVIVCQNGVFGGRMLENVTRFGGEAILVEDEWGKPVDVDKVRQALEQHAPVKALAFVHAETSTGVRSDAQVLCQLAQEFECLSIMDTVTGLGGIEVDVDGWGVDAVYSGTQKCLSCPPGIAPISFSQRAVDVIQERRSAVPSWFLDKKLVMGYWGTGRQRAYHHTAPVNALYALHEGLLMLKEEGLENAWKRHALHHAALRNGLEAMGLSLLVDPACRLPQLNTVVVPEGVDEAVVRRLALERYGLELGAGLGALHGRVWRIGLMGYGCNRRNVLLCLDALQNILTEMGYRSAPGAAVAAAVSVWDGAGA